MDSGFCFPTVNSATGLPYAHAIAAADGIWCTQIAYISYQLDSAKASLEHAKNNLEMLDPYFQNYKGWRGRLLAIRRATQTMTRLTRDPKRTPHTPGGPGQHEGRRNNSNATAGASGTNQAPTHSTEAGPTTGKGKGKVTDANSAHFSTLHAGPSIGAMVQPTVSQAVPEPESAYEDAKSHAGRPDSEASTERAEPMSKEKKRKNRKKNKKKKGKAQSGNSNSGEGSASQEAGASADVADGAEDGAGDGLLGTAAGVLSNVVEAVKVGDGGL